MISTDPAALFFLFLGAHAVADFALQTEWIATNKNRHVRERLTAEARATSQVVWPHLMTAHALHHGLFVFLISHSLILGVAETVVHWITDFGKCEKWYGFHMDQFIHVATKGLWVLALAQNWV